MITNGYSLSGTSVLWTVIDPDRYFNLRQQQNKKARSLWTRRAQLLRITRAFLATQKRSLSRQTKWTEAIVRGNSMPASSRSQPKVQMQATHTLHPHDSSGPQNGSICITWELGTS
ncbi:uncharacterized protein LOC144283907 [Canis aureus]